jgi:hypothetical protein
MNKQEKIEFVEGMTNYMKDYIVDLIKKDKIPDSWDGFELRQFIEDSAKGCNFVHMNKGRKRDYNNTVLVNNL